MHNENVEVFSDAPNAVVLRYPGRAFPGVLVQGDTLFSMWQQADRACVEPNATTSPDSYAELTDLRNKLRALLSHYTSTLREQGLSLPFSDAAGV
jgi:hypothetical protein